MPGLWKNDQIPEGCRYSFWHGRINAVGLDNISVHLCEPWRADGYIELEHVSDANEEDCVRENYREKQMDQKEREKFELYLIANPFVEADEKCYVSRDY